MKSVKLVKGQDAWIFTRGVLGAMTKGKCIEVLNLDGYQMEHYVIEIPTHVDPLLLIRNGASVSDDPDQPIGLWRK